MSKRISNSPIDQIMTSAALHGVVVPDAAQAEWLPIAAGMSVRSAIEQVLADLPALPPPQAVELVDYAKASRIRRTHAARAVLMAVLHNAGEPPR